MTRSIPYGSCRSVPATITQIVDENGHVLDYGWMSTACGAEPIEVTTLRAQLRAAQIIASTAAPVEQVVEQHAVQEHPYIERWT